MHTSELKKLLSSMSLEEKIGQLVQLPGNLQQGGLITGPAGNFDLTEEDLRLSGSYLSLVGAKQLRQLQTEYMARHPHHIPLIFMADVINGYRTAFPIPLAQGCTFRPDLVEEGARVAAKEASAAGLHVTFSPMADMVHDARWGRVMESTGEDAYLNGCMAAAMVRGYQGNLTDRGTIAACLKHFAGYGGAEGGRDYNSVELSCRTLREEYLPAYKAALDAGCAMVMTSFNTLDRIPSTANRWLMRDVLRDEMGFAGVLISDWAAVAELINHGVAEDAAAAAKLAIEAGVDMDMASPCYIKYMKKLVEEGTVSPDLIDQSALRVLELKNLLGLFENPYRFLDEADEEKLILCEEHRLSARRCAEASFVLLKNEQQALPLSSQEKVAVIGPYMNAQTLCGSWAVFAEEKDVCNLQDALLRQQGPENLSFAPGCPMVDPSEQLIGFKCPVEQEQMDLEAALQEAVSLAKAADKVVLALGEHKECTGEAASRGDITLPACQLRLLDEVCKVNENVIVVLFCGRPLDIRALNERAKAILVAWLPGTEGGPALSRTLYGHAAPTGRLSMAFPYAVGQLPLHYTHLKTGRPYNGNPALRFVSRYQDMPNHPLYPFGHGLTYTSFRYSPVQLSSTLLKKNESLTASVTVENTGSRPGTETVQLYIRDQVGSVARPVKELKGFDHITLRPGEEGTVSFTITEEMLRFWNIDMKYTSEPGEFIVFLGPDSQTENAASFTLC